MDDTREPNPRHATRRTGLPFFPAALILGVFALFAVWPPVVPGLPRVPRLVLIAALLGASLAWLASRGLIPQGKRVRHRDGRRSRGLLPRRPAMVLAPPEEMVSSPAWLQIMSGPDPEHLRRGLFEAANALIEHGERVLIVDGARRLRFHDAIRGEPGPGLLECMSGALPIHEAIQGGAEERLCFLPRGNPMSPEAWPQLGRLLLEARPQFDRVVLALDFAAPHDVGPALEGLGAIGWWCPDGSASILASALAERIGIPMQNMRLPLPQDVLPEVEVQRPALVESGLAPRPATASVPYPVLGELDVRPRIEPPVVDCDLQVRERLRFLVWMRSVQAESQRELEAQH